MSIRLTREEFLEKIFRNCYQENNIKHLRWTRVSVPGREVDLAHIIGVSDRKVYENLGLHIGVHEGEDHVGEAIGLMRFTPWESVVIAADIAVKNSSISIGFMDRFNGSLILVGTIADVENAETEILRYFNDALHFNVCSLTK
ncbi:MAG: BMC domain-containing protein [Olegusella sp.]|jgi:ethanolamine utilization protein EutS|nr:BMC domain-containing protein [Olegusella sp.]